MTMDSPIDAVLLLAQMRTVAETASLITFLIHCHEYSVECAQQKTL